MTKLTISAPGDAASLRARIGWFSRPETDEIIIDAIHLPKERARRDERALSFMVNDCGCAAGSIGMVAALAASIVMADSPIWQWSWGDMGGSLTIALLTGFALKALALAWSRGAARRRLAALERDLVQTMRGRT